MSPTVPGASILEPAEAAKTSELCVDPPLTLPPKVREFGYLPTLGRLRAGDLLLVSACKPGLVSSWISRVQRQAGFEDGHARWHHAAVYVGNDLVCEAGRAGVKTTSIYDYTTGDYRLRFRRFSEMSDLESCKLALESALMLGYRYSIRSVLHLSIQANRRGWFGNGTKPRRLGDRATICSQLYTDAFNLVMNMTLEPTALAGVSPAHLSANWMLEDVQMGWLSLPTV